MTTGPMRFHELDALRAFSVLLGVVLHAALFQYPVGWPTEAHGASFDFWYDELVHFIHGFRMPVFYLLSGSFTALLWERRGLGGLLDHRLKHIGLPFLICLFTIAPLQVLWWIWESGEEVGVWTAVYVFAFGWLFDIGLFWFLWVLLILVGVFALLTRLGVTFTNRWVWWMMVPLAFIAEALMTEGVVAESLSKDSGTFWVWVFAVEDTFGPSSSTTLWTNPTVLVYYGSFFLFGAFKHHIGWRIGPRGFWIMLPVAALTFLGGLVFEFVIEIPISGYLSALHQSAFAWLMCLGLMSLFALIAARDRPWIRYLSDASYWIYLTHLLLIFIARSVAHRVGINIHVEFLFSILVVTVVLLLAYEYGVRYTFIGNLLNGPRTRPASA